MSFSQQFADSILTANRTNATFAMALLRELNTLGYTGIYSKWTFDDFVHCGPKSLHGHINRIWFTLEDLVDLKQGGSSSATSGLLPE
jgi:hypothetical protein